MASSTAVHSNAFNFQSYVQHGVDPRTGQYTVSLAVPELRSNALAGPALPLSIAFSPMNTADTGFGLGWGITLTEYNPQTRILSLGSGETFKVTGSGNTPAIAEKKLDSFHFHDDGGDRYRVVHRSGLVEVLQTGGSSDRPLAVPVEVLGADGRALRLTYVPFNGGRRLETVSDESGELLRVERSGDTRVELLFFPGRGADGGALARFELQLDGSRRVTQVLLPSHERARWRLAYQTVRDIGCLSEVWTPTGAHEKIEYGDAGHGFPGNAHPALPRVTRHVVEPSFGQPDMVAEYAYTDANFLGLGALTSWSDDGLDNLYKVASASFSYGSTATMSADGSTRTVERRFSRFHLMTDEITTQGTCRKHVTTTHYADHPDHRNKPFDQQPPQCQLPMTVETRWELTNDNTKVRRETTGTRFDDHGNLTEQTNADGTREVSLYFPAEGDGQLCPKDPEGFVRSLRARTVYPAQSPHGKAPILRSEYTYAALSPLPGAHAKPFLVEQGQTLSELGGAGQLQTTATVYFDDPADSLRLGRAKTVSETLNGQTTVTGYQYATANSARLGEHVLQVIETVTGFDGSRRVLTQEHSLVNGEPLLVQDDDGVEIRYEYDAMERVTRETVAPGTAYAASRHYAYYLVANDGDQAWQQLTDGKGVQTRTVFDGVSRTVKEERQDADAAIRNREDPVTAAFRDTFLAAYNGLGELVQETHIDWIGTQSRPLVTGYGYDNWGERDRTTRPDRVIEHDALDPIGRPDAPGPIRRSWLEDTAGNDGGVTETWLDLFEAPVRVERFDATGGSISVQQEHHDGLGRLAEAIDADDASTRYLYDAFDRLVETTLPGNAVVARRYAAHSVDDLPTEIRVGDVVLGTQVFDGLDRLVEATTGGRTRTLHYDAGKARPARVVTADNKEILYEYQPQLGEEVTVRRLPGSTADYSYDPQDASLSSCAEDGNELQRAYYSTGQIRTETRLQSGGSAETAAFDYSFRGRLLEHTALGTTQTRAYDDAGRLQTTVQGSTRATFGYDGFGRVRQVASSDDKDGSTLTITIGYDDFGREISRRFDADGAVRELALTYNATDTLASQVLSEKGVALRSESFFYDQRGRLQRHECTGSELPVDAYGNAFTRQVFVSDALDNITQVRTFLTEGGQNVATFDYAQDDPVQLRRVTHSLAGYPAEILLEYDGDGNLSLDDSGRTLHYDALGRLTGMGALGERAESTYRYDALDVLAGSVTAGSSERRFYLDGELSARVQGTQRSLYVRAGGHVLAEQMGGTDSGTVLLATDRKNTVLGEVRPGAERHVAYTAFGVPSSEPLWTQLGYNGELHETDSGWQLLGNGYRAYNPTLMRFHSPDQLSPFGEGGINAYAYCGGDPVNNSDPTGHFLAPLLGMAGIGAVVGSFFVENKALKAAMLAIGGIALLGGIGLGVSKGWGGIAGKSSRGRGGWMGSKRPSSDAAMQKVEIPRVPVSRTADPVNVSARPLPAPPAAAQPNVEFVQDTRLKTWLSKNKESGYFRVKPDRNVAINRPSAKRMERAQLRIRDGKLRGARDRELLRAEKDAPRSFSHERMTPIEI
jgi:RHS repeat-associated protein